MRLATDTNPNGTNRFEVHVDTANTQEVWAVTVDWAELRTGVPAEDATVFIHGILGEPQADGTNSISAFKDYFAQNYAPSADRLANPTVSDDATIQERANAIYPVVSDLMSLSGASKVNLVAHSFGGLVARQIAWDHPETVDSVMMLSAPNGGTIWADETCAVIASGYASGGNFVLPQFATCGGADALAQMTTPYVLNEFNKIVRDRIETTYVAFASDADLLVPAASAEYLSKDDADHPGLHQTRPRLNVGHGDLVLPDSPALPVVLCEASIYPEAAVCSPNGASAVATLDSTSASTTLTTAETTTVPANGSLSLPLSFNAATVASVYVVSPDASQLTAGFGGQTFAPGSFGVLPDLDAKLISPTDGALALTNVSASPVQADVYVFTDSARRLTVSAGADTQSVTVSATLSSALAGDTVTARILDATGSLAAELQLAEEAPGTYSGAVPLLSPGIYSVAVQASGGPTRFAFTTLYIKRGGASMASFTESTAGRGDGLIDELIVRPSVTVGVAGAYRLSANLRTQSGAFITTTGSSVTLQAGTTSVELKFDGRDIFRSQSDGPYLVTDVVLADSLSMGAEAEAASLGSTQAYNYRDFRHDPVRFDLDSFSENAPDADANGVLDAIEVTGSVAVETAGSYAVNASLRAQSGEVVGEFQTVVSMASGTNVLHLVFPGDEIAAAGVDGPYLVQDLSVYSPASSTDAGYLVDVLQTVPYTAAQFAPTVEVAKTFSFVSSLDGWTGDGTDCTSEYVSDDGRPAGSLRSTVSGKNKTLKCHWESPKFTWHDLGVPVGAAVTSVRLESAATRVAECKSCQAGTIDGYRVRSGSGDLIATLWSGRSLPATVEPWQITPAQADRSVPSGWQGSASDVRVILDATLGTGNPGGSIVSLGQDEISLVVTYQPGDGAPDYSVSLSATGPSCPPGMICTQASSTVTLTGSGTALANVGPVSVDWRLYGISSDGSSSQLTFGYIPATAVDGAFDEAEEAFTISDSRPDSGFSSYDVEIRATAGALSTTRTTRVRINRCDPTVC